MKPTALFTIVASIMFLACKDEPKTAKQEVEPEKSVLEKIALAHGYENWKSVQEFTFTFNVDRDSSHFERTWVWKPKSNDVTAISGGDTLLYNRKSMDSIATKINGGFINDRYWVLAPFNLIWDAKNFTYEHTEEEKSPISGESMQKLTIVYSNEGGYTPGDAYDFYFKDDFILREWVFRKSNQTEPSMTTTWEDYIEIEGLKLAQDHRKAEEGFSLNFTDLSVIKN
ncbi:hypothetical protein FVB32_00505 [Flagellimonas hymeniacidonis]|uniref:Selenophosphate synthetase n=1 Tax=Flagellimonas hymeniacidonis TaxID=2603628 RepID=A0A5C8V629_9FLAO|nr:hypothetical protein [Flagellimonas hymeniacidonis]TXN36800.1 hypothetical protein FVB32_00505 [Flagellimonas hymeniacidonis]